MVVWVQKIVVRWRLFYFYALLLVILSVLPINGPDTVINHIFIVSIRLDYLLHCLIYIPLVLLLWIDKDAALFNTPGKTISWITVLFTFAAITEVIQYFLTYRAFNINDLISNCLGIILGLLTVYLINQLSRVKD